MTRHAGILALALGVRIATAAQSLVVPRDSVVLLDLARRFLDGEAGAALAHPQHPLFPLLTSLVARLGPGLEAAGILVSIVAGTLAALPLMGIARRVAGPRAAALAGVLYAVSPYPARFAGVPLTDSLHLALALTAIWCGLRALDGARAWPFAAGAGLAVGLAFLTRPEGLAAGVVLVPALLLARRDASRFWLPVVLAAGVLVVAAPYWLHLREARGAWTLTGKWKDGGEAKAAEWAEITGRERSTAAGSALETGRELAVTLHPLLAALALVGLLRRRRPRAAVIVIAAIALLILTAGFRVHWLRSYLSHRHVLLPAVLLLPAAAAGLLRLADALAGRLGRPAPVVTAVLSVLVVAVMAPKTFAAQGADKIRLIDLGREVAGADLPDGPLVVHGDPRIAWYAGRRFARPRGDVHAPGQLVYWAPDRVPHILPVPLGVRLPSGAYVFVPER